MPNPNFQENDFGPDFAIEVEIFRSGAAFDLSSATLVEVILRRGADRKVFTATPTTDGSDGLFRYETVYGDLAPHGSAWQIQAHVVGPTFDFRTFPAPLTIGANL